MNKKIKKICKILSFLGILLAIAIVSNNIKISANEIDYQYLIPGGDAIGLKMDTGVYVAGKYQVNTNNGKLSPWKDSDIKEGDKIISFNNISVKTNQQLLSLIASCSNTKANIGIKRGSNLLQTTIEVVKTKNGDQTIGLYVKDRLVGIGTLTFIEPESLMFASLGHGISDETLSYGDVGGDVIKTKIESIKKAVPGTSGEKRASLSNSVIGSVKYNSITGVYGILSSAGSITNQSKKLKVAEQSEVQKGKAQILTVISGEKVESFNIEITDVILQNTRSTKGIKIKITDDKLINATGGIIQGMSGSPIIQNDKIIGAVSHVSIDDPLIGYGMHIEWMIDDLQQYVA